MSVNTAQAIEFSNLELFEVELFERYLKLNQYKSIVLSGVTITVLLPYQKDNVNLILANYRKEFGVHLQIDKRTESLSALEFKRLKLSFDSLSVTAMRSHFAKGSIVFASIQQAMAMKQLLPSDKVVTLEYVIRPWLDKLLKRTESIFGSLTIITKGRTRNVQLVWNR